MPKSEKRTHRVVFYLTKSEFSKGEAKRKSNPFLRNVNAVAYAAFLQFIESK